MSGIRIRDDASAAQAASSILETLGCRAVLLSRGENGMLLCEAGLPPRTIAAAARQVYDVTGAGDPVAPVFALAPSAGAPAIEAASLANVAASVVVSKVGTSTAGPEEILAHLAG